MDMMCGDWLVHYGGWAIAQEPARIMVGGDQRVRAELEAVAEAKGIYRHLSFKQLLTAHSVIPKSSQVELQRGDLVFSIFSTSYNKLFFSYTMNEGYPVILRFWRSWMGTGTELPF